MPNVPCERCIVFAICRSKYLDLQEQYGNYELCVRKTIQRECSILEEFYHKHGNMRNRLRFHTMFMEMPK